MLELCSTLCPVVQDIQARNTYGSEADSEPDERRASRHLIPSGTQRSSVDITKATCYTSKHVTQFITGTKDQEHFAC